MAQVAIGAWNVLARVGALPKAYEWYTERALLREEFDVKVRGARVFFLAVSAFDPAMREPTKPLLTVTQLAWREYQEEIGPGVLIAPETSRLFVGAGERLLAYDLTRPARLWEDYAPGGFSRWGRHEAFIWMATELEFAVWALDGTKLWSTWVNPPWEPAFHDGLVTLDAYDGKRMLRMLDGASVA